MENANYEGRKAKEGPGGKDYRQKTEEQKIPGIPHAIWEHLVSKLQDDKVGTNGWYRTLSNPLVVVVGLILMAYWLFVQRKGGVPQIDKESKQLKKDVKRLKKKLKRLENEGFSSINVGANSGVAVLD